MANDYVEKIDLDGEQWDLKDSPLSEQVSNLQAYSTTEINTGMKWIDGKLIYRKVINFGTLPNNGGKSVNTGITDLGEIINIRGYSDNGNQTLPIPHVATSPQNSIQIACGLNNQQVRITTASDRSSYTNTKVILEYTKVTS